MRRLEAESAPGPAGTSLDLLGRVPRSARVGEPIECGWELENRGTTSVMARLYLFADRARLAELRCPGGRILSGRHHASATVVIDAGATGSVSAVLEPHGPGVHTIRTTLFTKSETVGGVHAVLVS